MRRSRRRSDKLSPFAGLTVDFWLVAVGGVLLFAMTIVILSRAAQ